LLASGLKILRFVDCHHGQVRGLLREGSGEVQQPVAAESVRHNRWHHLDDAPKSRRSNHPRGLKRCVFRKAPVLSLSFHYYVLSSSCLSLVLSLLLLLQFRKAPVLSICTAWEHCVTKVSHIKFVLRPDFQEDLLALSMSLSNR
jgi:hypothetical protein